MIHSSTLAGSRVVHQLSHRSTLLHLLGPELYTSFLIDPLFYTCWVQNYTLGANFRNESTLLHQLGPELYTRYPTQCIILDPASVEKWTNEKASVLFWTQQVQKSGPMRKLVYNSGPSQCRRMDQQLKQKPSVESWTQQVQKSGPVRKLVYNSGPSKCRKVDQ